MRWCDHTERCGFLRRVLAHTGLSLAVLLLTAGALRAAERSARSLVAEANRAMADGDNAAALKLLEQASTLKPDSPEIAYDLGVAHYRAGDYAGAVEYFMQALSGRDLGLEQRARYNLGNCAYAEGLKQQEPRAAIEKFKTAADRFREALQLDPKDADARANLERSGRMIRQLKEQQEQQKQEKQQQDPSSSQPESQPSSQPQQQPQSQPSSQPENQQQKQGENQQGQQQEGQQKEGQQKEGEQKDGQQKEGEQKEAPQQQGEQKDEEKEAQAVPATQRSMSKEEAERLLQLIRDKERQRREAQYNEEQKGRSREAPVEKDW